MAVQFREARPPDVSLLFDRVAETSWNDLPAWARDAYTREEIAQQVQQTVQTLLRSRWNVILVAVNEEGVNVGHVWIGETRDSYTGAARGYIYDLYVDPSVRGEGLTVSTANDAAQHLYESAGFSVERLLMSKSLTSS